jgi:hypothetical protein
MNRSRSIALLTVPALLVVALAACSGGGGGGGGTGTGTGTTSLSDCVHGHTWNLDINDLAAQLLTKLQSSGAASAHFTNATGEGTQTLTWPASDHVTSDTNFTFTVTAAMDGGLTMTVKQTHSGPTSGTLKLTGSTAHATGWDASGYTVTNSIDINGTTANVPITLPSDELGTDMVVTCSGKTMTTHTTVAGSYATQKWTRP